MFKTRYPVPGEAPGALTARKEGPRRAPVITLIEYDDGHFEERTTTDQDELVPHPGNERVTWINIDGLGDIDLIRLLGERFKLHPLALEDILDTGQRPKVEQYDDYLFIIAEMLYLDKAQRICGEQVSMFLGKTFLITLQEEAEFDVFEPVRARLRAGRTAIRKGCADYLAYALLDSLVDHYYPALENIGAGIEKSEEEMIKSPTQKAVHTLHQYRRTLAQIRRFVWPLRDVMSSLLHEETGIVRPLTKVYLRDCYDHTVQLMDLVESYRDVLAGLMEIYLSGVSVRTNEVIRVLTVITSIFIPLTFIVGVYGMNFAPEADGKKLTWNMPELYHPYGYLGVLAFMLALAVCQLVYFRRRGWI